MVSQREILTKICRAVRKFSQKIPKKEENVKILKRGHLGSKSTEKVLTISGKKGKIFQKNIKKTRKYII